MNLSRQTLYKGRNGHGTCVGIDIGLGLTGNIRFSPINSKDISGSSWFEIPLEDLPAFTVAIPGGLHELILNKLPKESLLLLIGINPALDAEVEKRLKKEGR